MTGLMVRTSASQDSFEIGSIGGKACQAIITKDHQTAAVIVDFSRSWRTVTACYARTRFARGLIVTGLEEDSNSGEHARCSETSFAYPQANSVSLGMHLASRSTSWLGSLDFE